MSAWWTVLAAPVAAGEAAWEAGERFNNSRHISAFAQDAMAKLQADLSQEVYQPPENRRSSFGEWKLDGELNESNWAAYTKGNHLIVVYRGTADRKDLGHDLYIAMGQAPHTIMGPAFRFFTQALKKHRPKYLSLTGHSLGGTIAYCVWSSLMGDKVPDLEVTERPSKKQKTWGSMASEVYKSLTSLLPGGVVIMPCHLFNPGAGLSREAWGNSWDAKSGRASRKVPDSVEGFADELSTKYLKPKRKMHVVEAADMWKADLLEAEQVFNLSNRSKHCTPTAHHIFGDLISARWKCPQYHGQVVDYRLVEYRVNAYRNLIGNHSMKNFTEASDLPLQRP